MGSWHTHVRVHTHNHIEKEESLYFGSVLKVSVYGLLPCHSEAVKRQCMVTVRAQWSKLYVWKEKEKEETQVSQFPLVTR